jgi:hypothetical protein
MKKPNKKDKKYYSDFIMINGIQKNKFVEHKYIKDLEKYIKHLESKVNNGVLDDVSVSLPTDEQIEETADIAYRYAKENFPIDDEYNYTQGYINGMTTLRNNIKGNKR